MFRSLILNVTLHRSKCSSSVFAGSFDAGKTPNLKGQFYDREIKNVDDKNDEGNDCSSSSLCTSKRPANKSSTNYKLSHPAHFIYSKCNASSGTSSFLTTKYRNVVCPRPLGARHFSNEATVHVPLVELPGILKWLSESAGVEFVQKTIIDFQTATNLPWWATIIVTTFVVRTTFTLPLSLYQHYIFAKIQNLSVEMNEIVKQLKAEANMIVSHHGWSEDDARFVYNRTVKKKWDELIQRENCHPAKGYFVLWTQIPLWITISSALRNMCLMLPASSMNAEKVYIDLMNGGFGWVVNLLDVDHYWVIPVSIGLVNLMNAEMMSLMRMKEETKFQKYFLNFIRFLSLGMIPIAAYVPASISLYWLGSGTFALLQNLALLSPKIRRLGGVPLTPTERANPYRHLIAQIKAKQYFNFFRKIKNP